MTIQTAPPGNNFAGKQPTAASHSYSTSTDLTGSFEIDGVAPGDYFVLGRLQGYLCPYDVLQSRYQGTTAAPASALHVSLTRVTVVSGQTANTTITLSRGAALGGTVRYDDGAPGIELPVHLFRRTPAGEWKEFSDSGGDSALAALGVGMHTDDRGRFYEAGLPAGMYKVMVNLPEAIAVPTTIMGRQSLNVSVKTGNALRVFNGDKFWLREAPAIDLQDGEERTDIDFLIPTTGLRTLRGFVVKQNDRQAIPGGTVRLLDPEDKSLLCETFLQQDGSFEFDYVPDGSYLINIGAQKDVDSSHKLAPVTAPLVVSSDLSDLTYALKESGH